MFHGEDNDWDEYEHLVLIDNVLAKLIDVIFFYEHKLHRPSYLLRRASKSYIYPHNPPTRFKPKRLAILNMDTGKTFLCREPYTGHHYNIE